jgi:hypothetical protein
MKAKVGMVEVGEKVIEQSMRADSGHCMIADAIRAQYPAWTHVSVDLQTIRVTNRSKGERLIYLTPPDAQAQLLRFDQGAKIEPWEFRLPRNPAQRMKVQSHVKARNVVGRPIKDEPPKARVKSNKTVVVEGGTPPPKAVLSNARGRRRVFGIRAARGFDPSLP